MAKVFEDDYSIKYVIIKAKQEMVEERGRYNATRIAWKMKLETIKQYPYVLSVTEGIVKAVYKVDVWKMAGEVGEPDRVMFEGTEVKDEEITKKFVGKMIPECYRKKGQASPVLYQKREGEADTEDEVAASAEAEAEAKAAPAPKAEPKVEKKPEPKAEKKPEPAPAPKEEKKEESGSLTAAGKAMEAVDLGLSVKWASCNLGASQPFESGSYYAWGEVAPKDHYEWETYKHCNKSEKAITKYYPEDKQFVNDGCFFDNKAKLDKADDAASKNLGGKWRMPTKEEFKELKEKCQWQWLSGNGRNGYIVKGPNGNSIFLPAAGDGYKKRHPSMYGHVYGYYWSSSLDASSPAYACDLQFNSSSVYDYFTDSRFYGHCVRPVAD